MRCGVCHANRQNPVRHLHVVLRVQLLCEEKNEEWWRTVTGMQIVRETSLKHNNSIISHSLPLLRSARLEPRSETDVLPVQWRSSATHNAKRWTNTARRWADPHRRILIKSVQFVLVD